MNSGNKSQDRGNAVGRRECFSSLPSQPRRLKGKIQTSEDSDYENDGWGRMMTDVGKVLLYSEIMPYLYRDKTRICLTVSFPRKVNFFGTMINDENGN